MTGKRKRGTAYNLTKTNKRKKRASVPASSPHPHGEIDEEEYYSVRDVVGERRLGRVTQYLIDWEDNPRTGEKYEWTWEPKENLTDVALADWEAKKLAEQAAKSPRSSSNTKTHDATPARVPTKRSKVRRVLSSSSAVQSTPISGEDLVTTPVNTERPIEIRESPEASSAGALVHYDGGDSPLFVPQDTDPVVPSQDLAFIAPSAPPSSYQECNTRGSTQVGKLTGLFTSSQSLPSSQQAIDNGARTVIKSRPVPAPTNPSSEALSPDQTFTGRVVPDSQSLLASTSHVSQPQTTILSTNGEEAQNQLIGDLQASVQAPVAESPGPDSNAGNKTPPSRSAFQVHKQPSVPFVERSSDQREPSPRPESPKAALAIQNPTPEQPKEPEQIPPRSSPVPVDNHNLQAAADSETSSPPEYLESIENHTAQAPVPVINHTRDSQNFGSLEAETSCPFDTQIALEQSPPTPARPPAPPHSQPASGNSFLAKILNPAPRSNSLPVQDNSLSSPFPSVPSHTLPDIGESAPPVPLIPSSPTHSSKATPIKNRFIMDRRTPTSEPKQGSMAPRIKAMKAEQAAKRGLTPSASPSQVTPPKPSAVPPRLNAELAAESPAQIGSPEPSRNGGRSPSAVPAALPAKKITQEEMNTSGRYPTLVPQEKENPLLRRQSTITGTASKEAAKGGNYVHSVPMALMGHQRDSYSLMIQQQKDIIERFLNTNQPDEELIVEIETLLDSLRRIVVHPDLYNIETYTQYDAPPITHARWAIGCSSKFYFLKNLIDKLRDKKIDIAIICPPGQLLQILESFLLGFKVSYYRADTGQTAEQDGCALKFAIMTPHEDASQESLSADVVICMDNSAETTGSTLKLLQEATGNELVMMTLAAPGTVEHVERCLSPLLSHQQKLRALVHGIFDLRHVAGKLEHGQLPSIETAKVIADFITNKSGEREWSVAALSMLENLDSQTESDIEPPQGSETVYGEKRPLDSSGFQMAASDTTKRRRLESNGVHPPEQPATINPLDLDISHISDSVPVPSHVPADSSTVDPSDLNETVKRLQSLLLTAQTSLAEHKHDLSELQYRHEDQRNEIVRLNRQKDEAVDMAQKAVTRMTEGNATSSNLRTENRSLKDQIAAMQQTLADHSVPERAEFEKQRIAFEKSQKENQILEKRLKTQQKDLDYAQEMYQNSSSAAQRLGTTNRELENALSHAQNRATGEQARAKQMTLDARSANLIKENKVLKAKIKEQTETLARKDKELSLMKEASRGRMGTRGTSVPRSPRMASPLKQGSRQSSPAAGELRGRTHPLRQG